MEFTIEGANIVVLAVAVWFIGTVINLFDSENATGVCDRITGCGDYEMGDPTSWQTPCRYQLGMRVEV